MRPDDIAPNQLFDLSGHVAVVTGGAGILGQYFCAALAAQGAKVAVLDREQSDAPAFAESLAARYSIDARAYAVDVACPASVSDVCDAVHHDMGDVTVLHNNAASKGESLDRFFEPLEVFSLDTWKEIMAVNLDGAFLVAREFGQRMAQRGRGSIIQTASIYGVKGPDQRIYEGSEYLGREINTPAVYSASKAGVIGLTRHLATYWADQGVRVNTLTPGGVESGQNGEFSRRYSARVPMGRMARPEEMVGALVFLASDASSYITGQNIIVDGGLSCW